MTGSGEPPSPADPAPAPRRRSRWTAGRVLGMVFATLGGLIGLALLAGGIAVLVAYAERDDDGYFNSDRKALVSPTYAITTGNIDLGVDEADWAPDALLGDVRVRVHARRPVFVGIGPDADVERYLGAVARDELVDFHGDDPELSRRPGRAPSGPPGEQDFWVARTEGAGAQAVTWDAESGRWTVVVMNANAARGVDVEADAGIKLGWALWAGIGLTAIGLLMSIGAVAVIVLIGRRADRARAP